MGEGDVVPDRSLNSSGEVESFTDRESEVVSGSGSASNASSASSVSSGGRGTSVGVDGSIGQHPAEQWENSSTTPPRVFAARVDDGYSAELAAHFDSLSDGDLESELSTIRTMDMNFSVVESRFVGGVAASRSGVDFSASDMYDVSVDSTAVDEFDGWSEEELVDEIEHRFDETFSQLDEYVAGRVATNIASVDIEAKEMTEDGRPIEDVDDPDAVESSEPLGVYVGETNAVFYSPAVVAGVNEVDVSSNTVPHEIAHAIEMSFNAGAVETDWSDLDDAQTPGQELAIYDDLDYEYVKREKTYVEGEEQTAPNAEAFRYGVANISDSLREVQCESIRIEQRGESPSKEIFDAVDDPQVPIREYQMKHAGETFAVGFAAYSQDMIEVFDKQPDMGDQIDEFITGHGWEEVQLDAVTTSGVGIDRPSKSRDNIPSDVDESDVGEIVRVSPRDGRGYVGHAVEATNDTLILATHGQYKEIPAEDIGTVQERRWNS